jgi:predicted nucleic acid-binding Zn ribbon protein
VTTSDPQPLSQAVADLIALRGLARVRGDEQIQSVWSEIAGERIATRTKVLGIKAGVLSIGVNNSALLNELASFHKMSLLKNLQKQHSELKIGDLKFRLKR